MLPVRHFDFLDAPELDRLFHRPPRAFTAEDDPALLAAALGATLYSPGSRPGLAQDIARRAASGVVSLVVCLEDAVPDRDIAAAETNTIRSLCDHARSGAASPLLFVRVREPGQISRVLTGLGDAARVLTGFVLPKFTEDRGAAFLDTLADSTRTIGRRLFAMPVLESAEVMHAESRLEALTGIRRLLDKHRDLVLTVRVGATDLSAVYGIRRPRDLTVWEVRTVADVLADVVNVFARAEVGYPVSGAVWEYYSAPQRILKPQLRETPFVASAEPRLRAELIAADLDGLIREVLLDRANGLTGKTVIHPTHVQPVHALSVVSHEEYVDALDVAGSAAGGGVSGSAYRNKMNESKPHAAWARRTLLRADAFGVASPEVSFVDLLAACLHHDGS
jgi:citrate lyase beta subunit